MIDRRFCPRLRYIHSIKYLDRQIPTYTVGTLYACRYVSMYASTASMLVCSTSHAAFTSGQQRTAASRDLLETHRQSIRLQKATRTRSFSFRWQLQPRWCRAGALGAGQGRLDDRSDRQPRALPGARDEKEPLPSGHDDRYTSIPSTEGGSTSSHRHMHVCMCVLRTRH